MTCKCEGNENFKDVSEIKANARVSFKIATKAGDIFYTFDYGETRTPKMANNEEYESSKAVLWDDITDEIRKQIIATYEKNGIQVNK